jgi:hypothetical protein
MRQLLFALPVCPLILRLLTHLIGVSFVNLLFLLTLSTCSNLFDDLVALGERVLFAD